jgi:hypothetical protein
VPNTRTDAAVLYARGGVASFAQKYDCNCVWHAAMKGVHLKLRAISERIQNVATSE